MTAVCLGMACGGVVSARRRRPTTWTLDIVDADGDVAGGDHLDHGDDPSGDAHVTDLVGTEIERIELATERSRPRCRGRPRPRRHRRSTGSHDLGERAQCRRVTGASARVRGDAGGAVFRPRRAGRQCRSPWRAGQQPRQRRTLDRGAARRGRADPPTARLQRPRRRDVLPRPVGVVERGLRRAHPEPRDERRRPGHRGAGTRGRSTSPPNGSNSSSSPETHRPSRSTACPRRRPAARADRPVDFGPWFQAADDENAEVAALARRWRADVGDPDLHALPAVRRPPRPRSGRTRPHRAAPRGRARGDDVRQSDGLRVVPRRVRARLAARARFTERRGPAVQIPLLHEPVLRRRPVRLLRAVPVSSCSPTCSTRSSRAGYDGWMEDFGEYTPDDAVSADGRKGPSDAQPLPPSCTTTPGWTTRCSAPRPLVRFNRSGLDRGDGDSSQVVWGGDPTTTWGFDGLPMSRCGGG